MTSTDAPTREGTAPQDDSAGAIDVEAIRPSSDSEVTLGTGRLVAALPRLCQAATKPSATRLELDALWFAAKLTSVHRTAGTLSAGQSQMVERALASAPDMTAMPEPYAPVEIHRLATALHRFRTRLLDAGFILPFEIPCPSAVDSDSTRDLKIDFWADTEAQIPEWLGAAAPAKLVWATPYDPDGQEGGYVASFDYERMRHRQHGFAGMKELDDLLVALRDASVGGLTLGLGRVDPCWLAWVRYEGEAPAAADAAFVERPATALQFIQAHWPLIVALSQASDLKAFLEDQVKAPTLTLMAARAQVHSAIALLRHWALSPSEEIPVVAAIPAAGRRPKGDDSEVLAQALEVLRGEPAALSKALALEAGQCGPLEDAGLTDAQRDKLLERLLPVAREHSQHLVEVAKPRPAAGVHDLVRYKFASMYADLALVPVVAKPTLTPARVAGPGLVAAALLYALLSPTGIGSSIALSICLVSVVGVLAGLVALRPTKLEPGQEVIPARQLRILQSILKAASAEQD